MSTTKKWISKLVFAMAFGLIVNLSEAQEKAELTANVTEVVSASAVNEVKPVITVPASLAKAMVTGKVEGGKAIEVKKVDKKETGESKLSTGNQAPVPHYYNGPGGTETLINNGVIVPGNWGLSFNTGLSCAGDSEVPCVLLVPFGTTLTAYLTTLSTPAAIRTAATRGRN